MAIVSVVVPAYKVEPYLSRCVKSILQQSFKSFELVLVDDGGPDGSGTICDEYVLNQSRILVIHQRNGGLSVARNAGIDLVKSRESSEWITFIDSDDWVSNYYLEALYDAVQKHGLSISITGYNSVSEYSENDATQVASFGGCLISPESLWVSNRDVATVAWGKLYDLRLFERVRYPEGKLHEDEFTTYRLLFNEKSLYLTSGNMYQYYQSPESITRSVWDARRLAAIDAFIEQMAFFKPRGFRRAFLKSRRQLTFTLCHVRDQTRRIGQSIPLWVDCHLGRYVANQLRVDMPEASWLGKVYKAYLKRRLYIEVRLEVIEKTLHEHGVKAVIQKTCDSLYAKD